MAKTLDFTKLKKRFMTVKLNDEKGTTLLINTPTKKIMDLFLGMKDSLSAENMGDEAISELYDIVAKVMSCNKAGVKISKETVEELLDFEDVIVFIQAYTDFINEVTGSKNS